MRISFAGGGTEIEPYLSERGGVVLSTTIDHYVQGCLKPEDTDGMHLESLDRETMLGYGRREIPPQEIRRELVLAAMKRLAIQASGFSLLLWSDAPPGSGLGSSSSLVVTILGLFRQWRGLLLPNRNLAELAYEIERCELSLPGGKQDQYAAAFGGFNRIEFTREGTFVIPLHLGAAIMNELHSNLLLCFTGRTHPEGKIMGQQMAGYCRRDRTTYEALDALKEIVRAMERALREGRLTSFGELLHEAWVNKRKLAPGITNDRIERFYHIARRKGALGGKILGAGGGGHLLVFCPFERRSRIAAALEEAGGRIVPFHFVEHGLETWRVV